MIPYRFDAQQEQPPASVASTPRRVHRGGQAALLALALAVGVTGGIAGMEVVDQLRAPEAAQQATVQASTAPQPSATSEPAEAAAQSTSVGRPAAVTQPTAAAEAAPQSQPATNASSGAMSVAAAVYSKTNGAVVEVRVSGETRLGSMSTGNGSGVVVDASGLILTNNHVVEGAGAVTVVFSTGEEREARVLGTDSGNDLAVLEVELPANTPVATLGDSDAVQPGETAIAIGSPFGLDQTITQGIISAVDRTWWPGAGRVLRNLLQTDAPINPGNSGGPLLNAQGEVIGINSMIESPVGASVGVGFAIPINTAKQLLPRLEAGATLDAAWLGISGEDLDAAIAQEQGIPVQGGALVTDIVPGGPAALVGIRTGDVITAADGNAVNNMSELSDQIAAHQPGEIVTLTIVRDGDEQQVPITLQAWPETLTAG